MTTVSEPARRTEKTVRIATAVAVPLVLFLGLQPDRVGLVPNGLDPWFYTGYAINFDDIFREIGAQHYFVSRWVVYLPARAVGWFVGPTLARLFVRWAVATLLLLAMWSLGRRWNWSSAARIVVAVVVLASPMFARAFLTDYVEWVVVAAGTLLVCQSLEPAVTARRSAVLGVLAATLVIANPLAITVALGPCVAYLARPALSRRDRVFHLAIASAGLMLTVVAGWTYFRVAHGLANVYAPTIDFMRANAGYRDPLRSPSRSWMGSFTWIYIPVVLTAGTLATPALRTFVRSSRTASTAFALLLTQYAIQWIDQFVRGGIGLEISYYWVFMLPTIGVVLALLVGSVDWTARTAAAAIASWVGVLALTAGIRIAMPGGWWLVLLLAALVGSLVLVTGRWCGRVPLAVPVGVLALFTLAMQVAAPRYDAFAVHDYDASPRYDEVFFATRAASSDEFTEAIRLEEDLDTLESDRGLFFVGFGGGERIAGIYGPHPLGRWLQPVDGLMPADALAGISSGDVRQLVVFGPSDDVQRIAKQVATHLGRSLTILDEQHDDGLGFRTVVLRSPDAAVEPAAWGVHALGSSTGAVESDVRTAVPNRDEPGYVVLGPYVRLSNGGYRASVTYTSPAPATQIVGTLDMSQNGVVAAVTDLRGTDGRRATVSVELIAANTGRWEYRVSWNGSARLDVRSVASEPVLP